MKVLSVVGARPQFVKVAPVAAAFDAAGHDHQIVHTGQHYDRALSDVFFEQLQIPAPAVHLGIGSGSHGQQTGAMLASLERAFADSAADCVVVYGDTNSTLAAAVAAVKMHVPVTHVEAGLRSFNRRMPEEHNRVLTDHAADLLLAPTEEAMGHLRREGLEARARLVGDVMVDVLLSVRERVLAAPPPPVTTAGEYVVATVHRAENTDDRARLEAIVEAMASLGPQVLLVAHPRLLRRAADSGVRLDRGSIQPIGALGYLELVSTVLRSVGVVTDSGGLQKEAFLLGVPCTTLRDETEWPETLVGGWNALVHDLTELGDVFTRPRPDVDRGAPYGKGHAAAAVVRAVEELDVTRP